MRCPHLPSRFLPPAAPPPPARRSICLCLLALTLLASCDRGDDPNQPVSLRFWNGFTGPDGRTMLALIKQFNDANPDVHVTMQRMDWGIYYNKLFVAGLGGRAPEVFAVHTDTLARFTRANFVRPVDDLTADGGIPVDDIDPNVWQSVRHDGKHYAIPLDIHMVGMFYNKKMFRDAGIVDADGHPRPPTNRAEFLDAVRRLTRPPDRWGFVFTWERINLYGLLRQNHGDIFTPDASACILDSPQNAEALAFCRALVADGYAPFPQNPEQWVGFLQGRVGMAFHGIFMLPEVARQKDLDWGAAPIPQLFDRPATWASSHNLCLRADLDGRQLDAAKRFIRYLSDHSLDWAAGGQVPVRKSLRDSGRFRRMHAQYQFGKQIPHAAYTPKVPFVFEYLSEFDLAIERSLRGSLPPDQALRTAARNINRIMARYASTPAHAGPQVPPGGAR